MVAAEPMPEEKKPKSDRDTRLVEFIDRIKQENGIKSDRQMSLLLGNNESVVHKIRTGIQSYTPEHVTILVSKYDLNPNWLQTGKGPMKMDDVPNPAFNPLAEEPYKDFPFVSRHAYATFSQFCHDLSRYSLLETSRIFGEFEPRYNKAIAIEVRGDSMDPEIPDGAKVIAFPVDKSRWDEQVGKVYAVVFGDEFVIKRITANSGLRKIMTLSSDNPSGGTIELSYSQIHCLFRVEDVIIRKKVR